MFFLSGIRSLLYRCAVNEIYICMSKTRQSKSFNSKPTKWGVKKKLFYIKNRNSRKGPKPIAMYIKHSCNNYGQETCSSKRIHGNQLLNQTIHRITIQSKAFPFLRFAGSEKLSCIDWGHIYILYIYKYLYKPIAYIIYIYIYIYMCLCLYVRLCIHSCIIPHMCIYIYVCSFTYTQPPGQKNTGGMHKWCQDNAEHDPTIIGNGLRKAVRQHVVFSAMIFFHEKHHPAHPTSSSSTGMIVFR